MSVFLLTGPIRTGKSSALLSYANAHQNLAGILSLDSPVGKLFYDIHTQSYFPMASEADPQQLHIGKFVFSAVAFENACRILERSIADENKIIIVDEIGPLELTKQGLHHACEAIFQHCEDNTQFHAIVVIRESIVEQIITHYNLSTYSVIDKSELENILEIIS